MTDSIDLTQFPPPSSPGIVTAGPAFPPSADEAAALLETAPAAPAAAAAVPGATLPAAAAEQPAAEASRRPSRRTVVAVCSAIGAAAIVVAVTVGIGMGKGPADIAGPVPSADGGAQSEEPWWLGAEQSDEQNDDAPGDADAQPADEAPADADTPEDESGAPMDDVYPDDDYASGPPMDDVTPDDGSTVSVQPSDDMFNGTWCAVSDPTSCVNVDFFGSGMPNDGVDVGSVGTTDAGAAGLSTKEWFGKCTMFEVGDGIPTHGTVTICPAGTPVHPGAFIGMSDTAIGEMANLDTSFIDQDRIFNQYDSTGELWVRQQ